MPMKAIRVVDLHSKAAVLKAAKMLKIWIPQVGKSAPMLKDVAGGDVELFKQPESVTLES